MIIEETNNATIRIEWKGWRKAEQHNEYVAKTQQIADQIEGVVGKGPRNKPNTFIRLSLSHKEPENIYSLDENEHLFDFTQLNELIEILKQDYDVSAIYLEVYENELAGRNYLYESIVYNEVEWDERDFPTLVQLYPINTD